MDAITNATKIIQNIFKRNTQSQHYYSEPDADTYDSEEDEEDYSEDDYSEHAREQRYAAHCLHLNANITTMQKCI